MRRILSMCLILVSAQGVFAARMDRFYENGVFYARAEGQVSICASGIFISMPNSWVSEKYRIKIYPQDGKPVPVYTEDFFNVKRLRCPSAVNYEYESKLGFFVNRYDYTGKSEDDRMRNILVTVIKWRDFVAEDMVKDLQEVEKEFDYYAQMRWTSPNLSMWEDCAQGMRVFIEVVSLYNLELTRLRLLKAIDSPTADDIAEMEARELDLENLRSWLNSNMGVYAQMASAFDWMARRRGVEPEPEPDNGGGEDTKFTFKDLMIMGGLPVAAMAVCRFGYSALVGDPRLRDHNNGMPVEQGKVMKDGNPKDQDGGSPGKSSYGGSGGVDF